MDQFAWKWQYVDENGTGMGWFTDEAKQEFTRNEPDDRGSWRRLTADEVASFITDLGQLAYAQT